MVVEEEDTASSSNAMILDVNCIFAYFWFLFCWYFVVLVAFLF